MWQEALQIGGASDIVSDIVWKEVSIPGGGSSNNVTFTISKPKLSNKVILLTVARSGYSSYSITGGDAELSVLDSKSTNYSNLLLLSISNIQSDTITITLRKNDTAVLIVYLFQATE